MNNSKIKIIKFPKIEDFRGNLTFLEQGSHIPFDIKRVFWLYDIPGGKERKGYAYHNSKEIIIPLSGSLSVEVFNGEETTIYNLYEPNKGLFIPELTWRKITNFVTGSVCLIVSDTLLNNSKYIKDINEYIKIMPK